MTTKIDSIEPDGKWEFNGEVAAVFDNMLERSIPQYEVMRKACFSVGEKFLQRNTWIVDLGCSRGEAIKPFIQKYGAHNKFIAIEVSEFMREAAKENLNMMGVEHLKIIDLDLRVTYPEVMASLTLAVLVIQFVPIEHRQQLIQNIYDHTMKGGAVVFIEKVLGADAVLDKLMVELYYKMKRENGYSDEDIDRKRLSLEGVLVPVTAKWNEELFRMAGFKRVDCFWRWMNFAGWIAIK